MNVELHCEGCGVLLRVPALSAGHRARCPACSHQFIIPHVESLLEDTVSQWIDQDVQEVFQNRDRSMETLAMVRRRDGKAHGAAEGEAGSSPSPSLSPVIPASPLVAGPHEADAGRRPGQPGNGHGEGRKEGDPRRTQRLWPLRSQPDAPVPGGVSLPPTAGRVDVGQEPGPPRPTAEQRSDDGGPRPKGDGAAAQPVSGEQDSRYPADLHVVGPVPHLMVKRVDPAGVRFAFDSNWLNHESFRASMPVRCAVSGSTAREKLLARPLVFLDRSQQLRPSLDQMTASHENRQIGEHPAREVVRMMGMIEGMPRPFAYAMPYYVSARFAHLPLHCETHNRSDGGITCEVVIPDQLTALDWLARVNGVCGMEYELLEQDVALLHGEAWRHLSDEARSRLAMWCKLGSRETMRHYFNDADFGRRDAGLAGLVITDQRLVFCKYHHRGQIDLDTENAAVVARCDARFASLSLCVGRDTAAMVKLHRHDLDELAEALASRGKLALKVLTAA